MIDGSRLRLDRPATSLDALVFRRERFTPARTTPGDVVIELGGAGINPSDVKAALGAMPHAVWPRTPGRDWAGIVVDGPDDLAGREAWGTGGDLGISRDGSHATHLVIDRSAISLKPSAVAMAEAGAIGVPFVTAWEGFDRAGLPRPGQTVLVCGGNGKVGQAAIQIAAMQGATVFAATRDGGGYRGHASFPVEAIDGSAHDVAATLRDRTGGHGADIVFNTVGSPYFEIANQAMAKGGRQILIATAERVVPFDILAFYRGRHSYFGIDTLALSAADCARILDRLAPGFESGALKPLGAGAPNRYTLDQAADAYRAGLGGAGTPAIFVPG